MFLSTDSHDRRAPPSYENFNKKLLNAELPLCDLAHFSPQVFRGKKAVLQSLYKRKIFDSMFQNII